MSLFICKKKYITNATNASRKMKFKIRQWDYLVGFSQDKNKNSVVSELRKTLAGINRRKLFNFAHVNLKCCLESVCDIAITGQPFGLVYITPHILLLPVGAIHLSIHIFCGFLFSRPKPGIPMILVEERERNGVQEGQCFI